MNKQEKTTDIEEVKTEVPVQEAEAENSEYQYEVKKSRKKEKLKPRDILLIVIPAAAALAAVVVALTFVNKATRQVVPEAAHQYYMDAERSIGAGTVISKNDSGQTVLGDSKGDGYLAELPVYYDAREAFMVTEDMVYVDPRIDSELRVDHFTEFYKDKFGVIHAKKTDADQKVYDGFLHNGKDMYIFLEPVKVEVDGTSSEYPALSYIEGKYGESVKIFNYDTKESEVVKTTTEIRVTPVDKTYTVLIFHDMLEMPDGSRRLLFSAPDQLDPLI